MINTLSTTSALPRTRALSLLIPSTSPSPLMITSGVETAWRDRFAGVCAYAAQATAPTQNLRTQNDSIENHRSQNHRIENVVRLTNVVPAMQAGRGFHANAKQDRPPRGEPR